MSNDNRSDFEHRYKTWHTQLSLIKSFFRIGVSMLVIIFGVALKMDAQLATILVIALAAGYGLAEIIGIIEEL